MSTANDAAFHMQGYLLINLTFFDADLVGCLERTFALAFFSGAVFRARTVDMGIVDGLISRHIYLSSLSLYPDSKRRTIINIPMKEATSQTRRDPFRSSSSDNDHDDRRQGFMAQEVVGASRTRPAVIDVSL